MWFRTSIVALVQSCRGSEDSDDYSDYGGDCDTLTCIAGSIAEGSYGVPEDLKQECRNRLPKELKAVLKRFDKVANRNS